MISVEVNNKIELQLVDNGDSLSVKTLDSKGNVDSSLGMSYGEFTMLMNAFRAHKDGKEVDMNWYLN